MQHVKFRIVLTPTWFVLIPGTGGDIYVVVTSEKENKVGAIREAFQTVFGKAIVRGMVCVQTQSIVYCDLYYLNTIAVFISTVIISWIIIF